METDIYFDQRFKFLGELFLHLKKAEFAYKLYLANNNQFLFAKILKGSNDSILNLLTNHAYCLTPALIDESLKLIMHLSIWREKWEELEKKLQPDLETEFVFQNNFTFPREAAQKLESEFLLMRGKMA
jgi:hypothetical protein